METEVRGGSLTVREGVRLTDHVPHGYLSDWPG